MSRKTHRENIEQKRILIDLFLDIINHAGIKVKRANGVTL